MAQTRTPETGADQIRRLRFRPGLAEQVLIGLVLGIAAGVFLREMAHALQIVGDAFIMLMQVAVIPYIVVSLITALGQLRLEDAKNLGLKAGVVLLVLWGIGIAVLLLTPLAFPDWPSASFFSMSLVEEAKPVDFLKLYIPANPFASLANGVVPATVVFSVLIGVGLIRVKNKRALLDPLSAVGEALMMVAGFVARLTPYGAFALTASAAGTLDLKELDHLQVYLVVYITMAIILSFWVLPALVTIVTPLRYADVMRALRGALITAFAAGSVLIVLPILAAVCRKLMGESEGPENRGEGNEARSTVDVLIPAAYNIPSLGNMLSLMFVLFAGWYIGSAVPLSEYPLVIGAGLASLFGGPILDAIRRRGASVRIAVLGNPEAIEFARSMLPNADLVPLRSLGDQRRILESDSPGVDAIADLSEEGAAWTLLYPRFNLVVPKPIVFTPQGIGVAQGNQSLAQTLDAWIIAEKARGTVDALYRYWLLGEAAKSVKPPRWSVIRNVLEWVR